MAKGTLVLYSLNYIMAVSIVYCDFFYSFASRGFELLLLYI